MKPRTIAREWLYFVASVGFGVTLFPVLVLYVSFPEAEFWDRCGKFWHALLFGMDFLSALLLVLVPYIGLQVIRSVLWSVRQLRRTE